MSQAAILASTVPMFSRTQQNPEESESCRIEGMNARLPGRCEVVHVVVTHSLKRGFECSRLSRSLDSQVLRRVHIWHSNVLVCTVKVRNSLKRRCDCRASRVSGKKKKKKRQVLVSHPGLAPGPRQGCLKQLSGTLPCYHCTSNHPTHHTSINNIKIPCQSSPKTAQSHPCPLPWHSHRYAAPLRL